MSKEDEIKGITKMFESAHMCVVDTLGNTTSEFKDMAENEKRMEAFGSVGKTFTDGIDNINIKYAMIDRLVKRGMTKDESYIIASEMINISQCRGKM